MESIKELKRICQDKGYEEHVTIRFYRIFSIYFTKLALLLKLKPNFITIISFLLGVAGGYFYLKTQFLLGSFLFFLFYLLDNVDGEISRYLKTSSMFGAWLDTIAGHVLYPYIFLTLGFGLYVQTGMLRFIVLGVIAATAKLIERSVFQPRIESKDGKMSRGGQSSIKLWLSFVAKFPIICIALLVSSLLGLEKFFLYFYSVYLAFVASAKIFLTGWRIYSSER